MLTSQTIWQAHFSRKHFQRYHVNENFCFLSTLLYNKNKFLLLSANICNWTMKRHWIFLLGLMQTRNLDFWLLLLVLSMLLLCDWYPTSRGQSRGLTLFEIIYSEETRKIEHRGLFNNHKPKMTWRIMELLKGAQTTKLVNRERHQNKEGLKKVN